MSPLPEGSEDGKKKQHQKEEHAIARSRHVDVSTHSDEIRAVDFLFRLVTHAGFWPKASLQHTRNISFVLTGCRFGACSFCMCSDTHWDVAICTGDHAMPVCFKLTVQDAIGRQALRVSPHEGWTCEDAVDHLWDNASFAACRVVWRGATTGQCASSATYVSRARRSAARRRWPNLTL